MIKHSNRKHEEPASKAGFSFHTRIWHIITIAALVICPIWFFLLPSNYFIGKESICLSVQLLDLQCYACGMTKALKALSGFRFKEAYHFNKISFIVTPFLIYYWYTLFISSYNKLK